MSTNSTPQISCVSLGMLIMDEILMPNKPPLTNVIGGSSTFVTLGLRLFANDPSTVGCLILAGSDFPPSVEEEVRSWGTTLVLKKDTTKPSSRGLLTYEDNTFGPKTFSYTTPPIRATPRDLIATPLLSARAYHFFGAPEDILDQVPQLLQLRYTHNPSLPTPFIVWEPLPSSCTPTALPLFLSACKHVDVFSPNHLELAALLPAVHAQTPHSDTDTDKSSSLSSFLNLATMFLTSSPTSSTSSATLILRCGEHGALALNTHTTLHVPAFHPPGSKQVVDPTGAGNAFLGGYVAGWLGAGAGTGADFAKSRMTRALCCGSVAASFAVEQIGLPVGRSVEGMAGERGVCELEGRVAQLGCDSCGAGAVRC